MFDFENLLRRYILHVAKSEGTDFLGQGAITPGKACYGHNPDLIFTDGEVIELRRLAGRNADGELQPEEAP